MPANALSIQSGNRPYFSLYSKDWLGHLFVLLHIRLVDDFAFQGRPAIDDGDDQEESDGNDVRQCFFQEGGIDH